MHLDGCTKKHVSRNEERKQWVAVLHLLPGMTRMTYLAYTLPTAKTPVSPGAREKGPRVVLLPP